MNISLKLSKCLLQGLKNCCLGSAHILLNRAIVPGPSERLCITLWYLSNGDAQLSIASSFRVSPPSVSRIISETCNVMWDEICKRGYLDVPDTEFKWRRIAMEFEEKWNFPHCLGCIDGKHVVMQAPARSGSKYFNYKKLIVLFYWLCAMLGMSLML